MAPAGSFASMMAAINAGCDSVYFGVEQLNMRARSAHNFKIEDLPKIAETAKAAGIKSYIALNTILYEHDMNLMRRIISSAKEAGIDAVIVADMAGVQYASEIGMHVHASTQLSISNYETVKFYARFCDTIVLARELDLKMIKNICEKIKEENLRGPSGELVRIEVFVHGALCIAQSGRCQMSIIQTNTSAQRGACLQECRKKYRIIDDESGRELLLDNQYVLSPKDLCTIGFLDQLVDAGIAVFKIEGRGRSPEYVDTVVKAYKEARDSVLDKTYNQEKIGQWMSQLEKIYNRGFSDGYYLGKPLPEWSGQYGSSAKEEKAFVGLVKHYYPKAQIAEIQLQASPLKIHDRLLIIGDTTGVHYDDVSSLMFEEKFVEEAKNPTIVTIPMKTTVRKNDKVYIVKERLNAKN